jgi:hypothetical protein
MLKSKQRKWDRISVLYCFHPKITIVYIEIVLCLTGRARGSWPARRSGRSVRKRMNSNIDVM